MNGYRAILKGTADDPSARPREGPKDTIWYVKQEDAKSEGMRLNQKHHDGRFLVTVESRSVNSYAVTWWKTDSRSTQLTTVYSPNMGEAHQLAYRYLKSLVGKGNFSINSVQFQVAKRGWR
jgi:hypothetical protein